MKCWQIPNSFVQLSAFHMTRENNCIVYKLKAAKERGKFVRNEVIGLPKLTYPAFADNDSGAASLSSWGGVRDHEQGGALLSPALRLASTNSFKYTNNESQQMRKIAPK